MYHKAEQRYNEAVRDVQPFVTSLRKKFVPLKTKTSIHQHDLRDGNLDEDALYKVRFSNNLFTKRMDAMKPTRELDVALLVDVSSSMKEPVGSGNRGRDGGDDGNEIPRYIAAQRLTALFVEALEHADSAQTWVYSFASQEQKVDIRQLYSPAFHGHKARIGDIIPLPGRQTPEFAALSTVLQHFRQEARERSQKAIIVFSDGDPDDEVLSLEEQGEQIRKLAVREQKAGSFIVHVSLGPSGQIDRMYPHSIPFPRNGYSELVVRFGRMLHSLVAQN
jgi:nitric oxide reductase activation protein